MPEVRYVRRDERVQLREVTMEPASSIFILTLKSVLTKRHPESSSVRGPLTIEASDEEAARALAALNFGMAIRRIPGEDTPICVWRDRSASSCIRVGASVEQRGTPRATPLTRESIDLGEGRTAKILSVCH